MAPKLYTKSTPAQTKAAASLVNVGAELHGIWHLFTTQTVWKLPGTMVVNAPFLQQVFAPKITLQHVLGMPLKSTLPS